MSDYGSRYSFKENPVGPTPISNTSEGIQDSRVKFNISTKEIIKSYKLMPMVSPFLLIPTRWNSELNMWDIATSDSWINASVDSNNYLNVHARNVEQLPSSLSTSGNLKVDNAETEIKTPIDKQAVYRTNVIETTTALSANSSYTSPSVNTNNYTDFQGFAYADQDGSFKIQISPDGSNWYDYDSKSLTGGNTVPFDEIVIAPYMRIVYTNGATDQTAFRIDVYAVVM